MASWGLSSSHNLQACPRLEQESWMVFAIGQETEGRISPMSLSHSARGSGEAAESGSFLPQTSKQQGTSLAGSE